MDKEKLDKQIQDDEGRKGYAYPDSEGYLTIGVGHLVDQRLGGRLHDRVIDLQTEIDIEESIKECSAYLWFPELNDARQNSVIEMMFQLGPRRFSGFVKTIECFERKDYDGAASQMLDSDVARKQPARWGRLAHMVKTGEFP